MPEMNNFKSGNNIYEVADSKARGISLTWAQYQALSYEEQHNGTAYYITDRDAIYPVDHELNASSGNAVANDVVTPHILAMENVLGAKNLALLNPSTGEHRGVNFSCTDGMTISVNGTTTGGEGEYSSYTFILVNAIEGDIIVTLAPSSQKIELSYYDGTNWYGLPSNGRINGTITKIGFNIAPTQTIDETVKLMIRPAGTDATYVPYAMTNKELTERTIKLDKGVVYYEVQGTTDNYGQIDVGLNLNRVTGIFVKDPICAIAVRATSRNTLQIWAVNNSSATADTLKQIRNEFVSLMITALPNSQV